MYNANVDRHPIYEENEFISEVGLGLYTMSKYVYASPEFYLLESERAWIGYVVVGLRLQMKERKSRKERHFNLLPGNFIEL